MTGFDWVLLDFIGFYWALQGFTGFYWVLPCFYCCFYRSDAVTSTTGHSLERSAHRKSLVFLRLFLAFVLSFVLSYFLTSRLPFLFSRSLSVSLFFVFFLFLPSSSPVNDDRTTPLTEKKKRKETQKKELGKHISVENSVNCPFPQVRMCFFFSRFSIFGAHELILIGVLK